MPNVPILSFNAGEASPQIDARSDVEKYRSLCRHLDNMIPRIYGGAERRPGTYYINSSYAAAYTIRMIPFIYSSEIAYILEFGNKFIRVFYDGAVITTIDSPYLETDLFQVQYKQLGDTMWLVHPDYPQNKLTRTSASVFSLDEVSFTKGPFLLRNDLVDPDESSPATMACSVTAVDATGTLTCSGEIFDADHVGAIFKLIHPRAVTSVTLTTTGESSTIDVKGTFSFKTVGTWTGTVILQRRENSSSSNDWEDYRTYIYKSNGNVQLAGTEDTDNVEYRIKAVSIVATEPKYPFSADITVNDSTQEGIVRIDSVTSAFVAVVTVLTELANTNATKRWAEGAWSDYRGYPSSVTFLDDRCIYGGGTYIPSVIRGMGERYDDTMQVTGFYGPIMAGENYGPPAQLITSSTNFTISSVKLALAKAGSPGTITVTIQNTTGGPDYIPSSTVYATGTTNGNTLKSDTKFGPNNEYSGEWREITFDPPYTLTAGTVYAIVVSVVGGGSNYINWYLDTSSPTYAGGYICEYKNVPPAGWLIYINKGGDFMFRIYGG